MFLQVPTWQFLSLLLATVGGCIQFYLKKSLRWYMFCLLQKLFPISCELQILYDGDNLLLCRQRNVATMQHAAIVNILILECTYADVSWPLSRVVWTFIAVLVPVDDFWYIFPFYATSPYQGRFEISSIIQLALVSYHQGNKNTRQVS